MICVVEVVARACVVVFRLGAGVLVVGGLVRLGGGDRIWAMCGEMCGMVFRGCACSPEQEKAGLVLEGEGDGDEELDDHGKRVSSELERRWGDMVM